MQSQVVSTKDNSLLLEIAIPFMRRGDELLVEAQALNGLKLWSNHFDRLTVCAYSMLEHEPDNSIVWKSPKALLSERNIELVCLPTGFHPKDFFKSKKSVLNTFKALIPKHQYLCFSSTGGIGSWGNIAADVAISQNRDYALWFDWIVEDMPAEPTNSIVQKAYRAFSDFYVRRKVKYAIENSALGLYHGKTVYDGYKGISKNPQLVHDIHISKKDVISDDLLNDKLKKITNRSTLNIGYIGRLAPMKAPTEWVEIVEKVAMKVGHDNVNATWLGDGPMFDEVSALVEAKKLNHVIQLKGFVSDRKQILEFLRGLDVFVFCHITPESPRNLIESIISGTPLVGYASAYAIDLVGDRGGALLSDISDIDAVANQLIHLAENNAALQDLTRDIAESRMLYNDEGVFKHRSDLIKEYM